MKRTKILMLSLVVVALGACDRGDGQSPRGGQLGDSDQDPQVGGGFPLDPDCDLDCEEVTGGERVCAQYCPDGCVTLEVTGTSSNDQGVSSVGILTGYCADDFPEPDLGPALCNIMFVEPSGAAGDCLTEFSAQTCEAARDMCLDGL